MLTRTEIIFIRFGISLASFPESFLGANSRPESNILYNNTLEAKALGLLPMHQLCTLLHMHHGVMITQLWHRKKARESRRSLKIVLIPTPRNQLQIDIVKDIKLTIIAYSAA